MFTAEINTTEFNTAFREYRTVCKRELSWIINKKMFWILKHAWEKTPRVTAAAIQALFGVERQHYIVSKGKNKGAERIRAITHKTTMVRGRLAKDIIQAARYHKGLPPLTKEQIIPEEKKLIAKRVKACGSLRAGWYDALMKFMFASKEQASDLNGPRVKQKSKGKPATETTWNVEAMASYNMVTKRSNGIDPRCVAALQYGFDKEAASMREYVEKRIQSVNDRFSGR